MVKKSPQPRLPSGTRLGPYEIISLLGSGGMGTVYRAKDTRLGREVAIKVLSPEAAADSDLKRRFELEARAASALNHPHMVTIYDVGSENGHQYMVSELVEGESLRALIHKGPLPLAQLLEIALQMADGLTVAHEAGIVHRDLKPENVMFNRDGRAKILDFGLAKVSHPAPKATDSHIDTQPMHAPHFETTPGVIMGTVSYMSPEQAQGDPVDFHSDQFSFGLLLYEMATGKRPFERKNTIHTLAAIIGETPPSVLAANPLLPESFGQIVGRCLAKTPEKRYATTRELFMELQKLRESLKGESGNSTSTLSSVVQVPSERAEAPTLVTSGPRLTLQSKRVVAAGAVILVVFGGLLFLLGRNAGIRETSPSIGINSIAVLPFVNESGDSNTEYLSDGITESLINSLSQVPNLRVMARSTVFRYKGHEADAQKAGRELKVGAVLTGRVAQRDGILKISTELVDSKDGSRLWGEQYNRTVSDLFVVQDEISKVISEKLRLKLNGEQIRRLTKHYTENPEAHEEYLKGRYACNKRTRESLEKGIEHFNRAIKADPNYALAYAGLADAFGLLGYYGIRPPKDAYPEAKAAARKALELDPTIAEAHTSLADIRMYYDWNWDEAEQEFKQAIALNPSYATAHQWYAICLGVLGRNEEAFKEVQIAQQLDPLSLPVNTSKSHLLYYAHQYDQAIAECQKTLEIDNFVNAHAYLGLSYEQKGLFNEAINEFQKARNISEGNPVAVAMLAHAYALSGKKVEAQKLLKELEELSRRQYVPSHSIALVYLGLGNKDQCFKWLDQACDERYRELVFLKQEPRLDPLRNDPRFIDLLKRIGLAK